MIGSLCPNLTASDLHKPGEPSVNGDTTAAIWWTKTLYGWHDTTNVNVTNESCYDSTSIENTVKELEQRANRLDVKIDLGMG